MADFVSRMLPLPAGMTEVAEALQITAKVRSDLIPTDTAGRILQKRIDLYLLVELWSTQIHENSPQCLHITFGRIESNPSRPDWVFIFI